MKAAFVLPVRNKEKFVEKAVLSIFAQTYPCHIILSDQFSTDKSFEIMKSVVHDTPHGPHKVDLVQCPVEMPYGMAAANAHVMWMAEQTDAEWIFQSSADDYALPDRVKVCMEAADKNPCVAVGCTMAFLEPGQEFGASVPISGYPTESGYISGGQGTMKLAWGSCNWAYRRDWLLKVGSAGDSTPDVYYGYIAAVGEGAYAVANPQHVHVRHDDLNNMGFEGKMRAAEKAGDESLRHRLNELNRFQLYEMYFRSFQRSLDLYPMQHENDKNAMIQMLINQSVGWYQERKNLHRLGIQPDILPCQ